MRSVVDRLATSLGRRDEHPNQDLAKHIAGDNDKNAVRELVENLANEDKNIQSDCIKVLYEIGELKPTLIAPYYKELIGLLDSKNNRLVWGAMTALDTITLEQPKAIFANLRKIIDVADNGSVITRDHGVGVLIKLTSTRHYAAKAFPLLVKQLKTCPTNQFPMYAENALPVINDNTKAVFAKTLASRVGALKKESQRRRIEKILNRINRK